MAEIEGVLAVRIVARTEGFFANDPMGLPIYVGTPSQSPRSG
jgi:hypothetical protein